MNFDFSEDQRRLQEGVRRVLSDHSTSAHVRRVLEGEAPFCADTWRELAGLGALGIAIAEEHGGAGMGLLELCLVAEEAGRSLAAVPLLPTVYLAAQAIARAGSPAQAAHWLPRIASGEAIVSAVIDERRQRVLADPPLRLSGDRLSGVVSAVPDGMAASACLLLVGGQLVLADLTAAQVGRSTQRSLDPTRPLARTSTTRCSTCCRRCMSTARSSMRPGRWARPTAMSGAPSSAGKRRWASRSSPGPRASRRA